MKRYFIFFLLFAFYACSEKEQCKECDCGISPLVETESMEEALARSNKGSATSVDTLELKESIAKIEMKYGEQWDFCDCVIKGDSINKAFSKPNLPDAEFERLAKRFDVIDEKCQAFRIQDANRTPEQRDLHERKVRKCLKEAGIKNR